MLDQKVDEEEHDTFHCHGAGIPTCNLPAQGIHDPLLTYQCDTPIEHVKCGKENGHGNKHVCSMRVVTKSGECIGKCLVFHHVHEATAQTEMWKEQEYLLQHRIDALQILHIGAEDNHSKSSWKATVVK